MASRRRFTGLISLLALALAGCTGGGGKGSSFASVAATGSGAVGSGTSATGITGPRATAAATTSSGQPIGPRDSYTGIFDIEYSLPAKNAQTSRLPARRIEHLVYPVLGFPSLVEPTGVIGLKILLKDGGKTNDWKASILTAASAAPVRFPLSVLGTPQYDTATGVYTVDVLLPPEAFAGVYDLVVESASFTKSEVQRNAVRILDVNRQDPTFGVIADPQIQDLATTQSPDRLRQFLEEIRLRDPDFVLFVGDMNFGADYATEYEENLKIFDECGIAIFYVPGNHDAYATLVDKGNGTYELLRDGLNSWRTTFGPTLYSFDWRGHHLVGVNSMAGTPERRNSSGNVVANYGGKLEAPELDWIEQDVTAAAARGRKSVLFMHHDPSHAITPDVNALPIPLPAGGFEEWNDKVAQDRIDKVLADHDGSHVLYGHIHDDRFAVRQLGGHDVVYAGTTTLLSGRGPFGYRWGKVNNGLIGELNAGPNKQSIEFPVSGVNVASTFSGKRDGSETKLEAKVKNDLDVESRALVELAIKPANAGVTVQGGNVVGLATAENGNWVARVEGRVAAKGSLTLVVEPATNGNGLRPNGGASGTSSSNAPNIGNTTGKAGPKITLTSPAHASMTTSSTANVEGTIANPSTVASIFVQGAPALLDKTTGKFVAQVPLVTGLNTIIVEAYDNAGRRSRQTVSLIQGTFSPSTAEVQDAVHAHLGPDGLAAVAREATAQIPQGAVAKEIMARNPLAHTDYKVLGVTIASAHVEATKASTGQPVLTLKPEAGDLDVRVDLPNVAIGYSAKSFGGIPYSITGDITSTRAVLKAKAKIAIQNGTPKTSFQNVTVTLENFNWTVNGIPAFLTNIVEGLVRKKIEGAIADKLSSAIPPELDKVLSQRQAFTQTILSSSASFDFKLSSAKVGTAGVTFGFEGNCAVVTPSVAPKTSPGSLVTRGTAPDLAGQAPRGFAASANEDMMNRVGHEVWRTGFSDLTIDQALATKIGLPPYIPLEYGLIGTYISPLGGKLPSKDPIAFVLSPRLPPVFRAVPGAQPIDVGAGELLLEIYDVAPGKPRTLIVSMILHVRSRATPSVGPTGLVNIKLNTQTAIEASVLDSPLAPDMDPVSVSNLIQFALPPILATAANHWSGFQIPMIGSQTQPKNVSSKADGTFVTLKGDL